MTDFDLQLLLAFLGACTILPLAMLLTLAVFKFRSATLSTIYLVGFTGCALSTVAYLAGRGTFGSLAWSVELFFLLASGQMLLFGGGILFGALTITCDQMNDGKTR